MANAAAGCLARTAGAGGVAVTSQEMTPSPNGAVNFASALNGISYILRRFILRFSVGLADRGNINASDCLLALPSCLNIYSVQLRTL